ncbi:hypothetical protein EBB06_11730 [Crenobacter cavernae]|uniref:Phage head morphogenesis domain-containing protein n=1 Tax=Crenobacter cavernae TaxID=2290923 RepID=A0ABY0FD83_9NEIS|nr:hypothetical protein EBB06_11730 [Crenobacter cavernae]
MNSAQKIRQMADTGVTHFKWVHSGVPLKCGNEDHSKLDGRQYEIAKYLASGKPLPGESKGCRCTFVAVLDLG